VRLCSDEQQEKQIQSTNCDHGRNRDIDGAHRD
jgi:hypothetical protein